jgi:hypothetical protein
MVILLQEGTSIRRALKRLGKGLPIIALASCIALTALFAEAFVLTHIEHDCTGEGCEVCLQMEASLNLLKGLGLLCVTAVFGALSSGAGSVFGKINFFHAKLMTPVALRVKLNF